MEEATDTESRNCQLVPRCRVNFASLEVGGVFMLIFVASYTIECDIDAVLETAP